MNEQAVPILLAASRGVQVTVVTPTVKDDPGAGTQVTDAIPQLSLATGGV